MSCTAAAIIALLGYMPPKGTEIIVPRSQLTKYTRAQINKATTCADRHGIKWRVDEMR